MARGSVHVAGGRGLASQRQFRPVWCWTDIDGKPPQLLKNESLIDAIVRLRRRGRGAEGRP